jgi:hypothetical protein
MSLLQTIGVSLITGVLSSFLFLLAALLVLRPKLRICTEICKMTNYFGEAGNVYLFKVYNKSWFSAFDLTLQLSSIEFYQGYPKGLNRRILDVPLVCNQIKHIPKYNRMREKEHFANHCVLFRTTQNIEDILKNSRQCVELQITLRHGLSGLSRVYRKEYHGLTSIKEGEFKFGNFLNIC